MLSDTCIDAYRTFHVCEDCHIGLNFTIIVLIKYLRYVDEINFNCRYGLKDAVILLLHNCNDNGLNKIILNNNYNGLSPSEIA